MFLIFFKNNVCLPNRSFLVYIIFRIYSIGQCTFKTNNHRVITKFATLSYLNIPNDITTFSVDIVCANTPLY